MFSRFREKSPPYALDYTNPINNINYDTINNLKNKEILINNENAHLLVEKSALEKNLKKHSMFINALSWKKFNSSKKKSVDSSKSKAGLAFRTPLDNIHPIVDNNKNIQNALCHGTKSTSLSEDKRNLDIVRSAGGGVARTGGGVARSHATNITATSHLQQKKPNNSACSNVNLSTLPPQMSNTTRDLQSTKPCNYNISNNNFKQSQDQASYGNVRKETNDNEDPLKKLSNNNNNIKTEQLVKPAPKKTVIQVNIFLASLFLCICL